ncbi:MAG: UDP-2-acetamido-2,6-dideoxy-hexulose 4-reductase [Bacillaceae bacterium]|jgi:GDP-4-dehydro-6-deoxy-D-mannose reductase|uniref:NAD-dependent epimerase/dehydratase family protein n=1 Tax=Aeribacillus TaxID=1055323 RepID=UPI0007B461E3|nr:MULTISPECIES: NAD-dependent epimerase/dehydratase family protein [Aeribacillus]KZM52814.1 UDP-2-acetamido-2,6-dideoxy-hexulose 4-reductase [Aeribacillus pallidus]MED0650723.1 NAD-dependent epimerase/dehydratase family protein [Aeribacillus composti]MED4486783.1 NAD-dependent epimerase/dehydratase family protein [Aeribacillus pallidus]REJ22668.1 MAG: UDP-2-acetamido-2,6-dideoxy-hexulose 4-reductase [Bacillaceae bacterium]
MNPKPKMLITGASGFTGQHACEHFSKLNYDITAVTRNQTSNQGYLFQVEPCELTSKNSVFQLIEKVKPDYLLHLAGINHVNKSWKEPILTIETNFLSTLYLLDAVRQIKPSCKIITIGSSLQFNPDEIANLEHPYSLSKTLQVMISQAWEKLFNMNIVIAQPSNIIGPGRSKGVTSIFATKIVQMEKNKLDKVLVVNNLTTRRDFIDVRDVVKAFEVLFNKGVVGEIYKISSGKTHSLGEVVQIYKTLTDVDFKIEPLTTDVDKQIIDENPFKLFKLGWNPTLSIHCSLTDTLNYFRLQNLH